MVPPKRQGMDEKVRFLCHKSSQPKRQLTGTPPSVAENVVLSEGGDGGTFSLNQAAAARASASCPQCPRTISR